MTSEWDGTPWGGTAVQMARKAESGPGVAMIEYGQPYRLSREKVPQRLMREAQLAYHLNGWIKLAESTVTRRVAGMPWHLEDDLGTEIPDDLRTGPPAVLRDLLEKPQARSQVKQPGCASWRSLISLTSRHLGLCGMAYWYLDQREALTGFPLSILYINPARVYPGEDAAGNLQGWILDPSGFDARGKPSGGTPLTLNEVLPFYLDPPDAGNIGTGIYEAAILKAQITHLADQHAAYVLGTGGRIAGILSPKAGALDPKQFADLEREFRNVNEAPDAAKRTTILSGPVDWNPTAAAPDDLNLIELSSMNRDDILAQWGVPPSQAAIPAAAGLNAGETRKYDEATLMQGSVHDRIRAIHEGLQYGLLDALSPRLDLVFEEPEFDDRTPLFELAAKARDLPLRNKERRELIGLAPFGEDGTPDPRDEEVWLPVQLTVAYEASGLAPEPEPVPPALLPFQGPPTNEPPPVEGDAAGERVAGKASLPRSRFADSMHRSLTKLRTNVEKQSVPRMSSSVEDVLAEQRAEIIARIRANAAHVVAHPGDDDVWWNGAKWDRKLRAALAPEQVRVAENVSSHIGDVLQP